MIVLQTGHPKSILPSMTHISKYISKILPEDIQAFSKKCPNINEVNLFTQLKYTILCPINT